MIAAFLGLTTSGPSSESDKPVLIWDMLNFVPRLNERGRHKTTERATLEAPKGTNLHKFARQRSIAAAECEALPSACEILTGYLHSWGVRSPLRSISRSENESVRLECFDPLPSPSPVAVVSGSSPLAYPSTSILCCSRWRTLAGCGSCSA